MVSRTFILTTSPFTKAQIALASFVPNIKQPHQDSERPYQVTESDYEVQTDEALGFILKSSSESHLKILVTKLFSGGVERDSESKSQVTADSGYIYSLNSPQMLFKNILPNESLQRWLEDCKESKISPRFVVGYRTFVDSRLTAGYQKGTSVEGHATVPVGEIMGDPTGITDVGAKAGYAKKHEASAAMTARGERIYAICYRKVKVTSIGKGVAATLAQDNVWEAFAASRGEEDDDEEDEFVKAELQGEDDQDGYATFSVQASGEPHELFAVL